MSRRKKNDLTYKPYDPDFHPQDLINRMGRGELDSQIYPDWNIGERTFYRWVKDKDNT